jgi:predicted DNA-binding transcriptional regulator YafY
LNKAGLAALYHVSDRSIQRDMESLRCFIADQSLSQDIIFDHQKKGYRLVNRLPHGLGNGEIVAVCKILLESRSLRRDEMLPILDKLIDCAVPEESKTAVKELIANEKYHYLPPHHDQPILKSLWEIGQAIQSCRVLEIKYERIKSPKLVKRTVEPVGIMFSEYYFYLTAFLRDVDRTAEFENANDPFPTIYRIDRIKSFRVLDEHFKVPYKDRFEEGEFRKRVQFMYGGKLQRVRFHYTGTSLEAVLDRLPTAQVTAQDETGWMIEAEVFGKGIEMWLRSQGDAVSDVTMQDIRF